MQPELAFFVCSIEDDLASGDSDEGSADADSQPRPELPEEMAAELLAAAEADRLSTEAEEQEAETEELQVSPVEPELLPDQPMERLSEGLLAEEEPGSQQRSKALEEQQAVSVEDFDSAAVGEGVVVTAEAAEPSADQAFEGLHAEAEGQTRLEGGFY